MTDSVETVEAPTEAPASTGPNRSRWIVAGVVVLVVALVPFARWLDSYNYVLQVGTLILMWIAMVSAWNIMGGYTGYTSLGHNVFFGIGAYVGAMLLLEFNISPFVSAPVAGLVAMAVGAGFGLITFRAQGPAFIIATIALLLVTFLLLDNWEWVGGSNGLSLPLPDISVEWVKVPFYYAMFVSAILSVMLGYRVAHSKMGLALRAIAADEVKGEVAGINTRKFKVMAFALSAFFPGVVGAFWGYSLTFVRPVAFFAISVAAQFVLMAIIGGRGTVAGPVIGATFLILLNELSVTYLGGSEINLAFTGLIMVLVLIFFPLGLVGTLRARGRLPQFLDWD